MKSAYFPVAQASVPAHPCTLGTTEGEPGARGLNLLIRKDGRTVNLGGKTSVPVFPGVRIAPHPFSIPPTAHGPPIPQGVSAVAKNPRHFNLVSEGEGAQEHRWARPAVAHAPPGGWGDCRGGRERDAQAQLPLCSAGRVLPPHPRWGGYGDPEDPVPPSGSPQHIPAFLERGSVYEYRRAQEAV